MSEADAAPKEESPSREAEEAVVAKTVKDERRSSSVDIVGEEFLQLHSIFYQGKTLRLPANQPHMRQVVFRLLKNVYFPLVKQIMVGLPDNWRDGNPNDADIALYAQKYNKAAKPYANNWKGSYNTETLREWGEPQCTQKVATEITNFAYECAVPRPADLNQHYKSFTSETYGETNLEQMASIIDELGIGPNDVFVDLGSGIGQLVCFAAAYARCKKSVGIELSKKPAELADNLGDYFKRLMKHFGKQHGKFEHIQGDFLNPKFKKLICEEATVIFINNFAFVPNLMIRITNEILQDLKHGTRIVTTKQFGANNRDITFRSTSDINSMIETKELTSMESGVSWTHKPVTFYLTTMDHTKLIKYYESQQQAKLQSRESSEAADSQKGNKRKKERESSKNGHRDKNKTEQAAASTSHQSPKWNEPDTDYAPPVKKSKKEKHRDIGDSSSHTMSSSSKEKDISKKNKKSSVVSKPHKQPKSSQSRYSTEPSSTSHRSSSSSTSSTSHPAPSLPKATAPPPSAPIATAIKIQQQHQLKLEEEVAEPDSSTNVQLDAKTMSALDTIREAATTSAQAAAIQDAISSVLSQPETQNVPQQPFEPLQSLAAPVAVYPSAQITAPPPPPPPTVMPPCSEIAAEQRHTFMIPPTDPFYNMIVTYYFEIKNYCNMSKNADPAIVAQLRQDIENEKARRNELSESIQSTTHQIEELLANGVNTLKNRLDELGMPSVSDVTELLAGSKQIVTQHKGLTTNVAQMESSVALEEHKLRMIGGPEALRHFDEAIAGDNIDIMRLSDLVITTRPPNFVAQCVPDDVALLVGAVDAKVSPSSRRPRQQKPRQANGNGGKRGHSSVSKAEGSTEAVELEIQQFVQHALKVDNAVKEKERKERLHRPPRPIVSNSSVRPPTTK